MSLSAALDELRSAASELNAVSDQLNAQIDDFEEALEQMGVGVSVWLIEPLGDEPPLGFGYAKIAGKWRVAVCPMKDGTRDVDLAIPLASAARAVRMLAVERFERLARALTERINALTNALRETTRNTRP